MAFQIPKSVLQKNLICFCYLRVKAQDASLCIYSMSFFKRHVPVFEDAVLKDLSRS